MNNSNNWVIVLISSSNFQWTSKHLGCVRLVKTGFCNRSKAKSVNRFHLRARNPSSGWITFKKPKYGSHGFPFLPFDLQSCSREQWSFFCYLRVRVQDRCDKEQFFKFLFRIRKEKKSKNRLFTQRWNSFTDFAFDCKYDIRILNPDFPFDRILNFTLYK